jgi:DNA-binding transcriptional ArsR family regulator
LAEGTFLSGWARSFPPSTSTSIPTSTAAAGELGAIVQAEFGISQPAVSQHLRVLRDNGFATVRAEGTRRLYAVDAEPLRQVDEWLNPYRRFWTQRLDPLATELARGKRDRRAADPTTKGTGKL